MTRHKENQANATNGARIRDVTAGLSIAGVLLPEAIAYASIANLPPQMGIIALLVGLVCYGLAGSSRFAIVSATSVNEVAGAATRFAGTFAAIAILLAVRTLLPAIALLPQPVLAAIVIHAVSRTLNPLMFLSYFRWHRDRVVVVAAVAGVLMLGVINGLLAAIAVSILMMLRRFSDSTLSVLGQLLPRHGPMFAMKARLPISLS